MEREWDVINAKSLLKHEQRAISKALHKRTAIYIGHARVQSCDIVTVGLLSEDGDFSWHTEFKWWNSLLNFVTVKILLYNGQSFL